MSPKEYNFLTDTNHELSSHKNEIRHFYQKTENFTRKIFIIKA